MRIDTWLIGRFFVWAAISSAIVCASMLGYYLMMHSAPSNGLRQSIVILAITVFAFGFSNAFNKSKSERK
jgi:hypothetical protein